MPQHSFAKVLTLMQFHFPFSDMMVSIFLGSKNPPVDGVVVILQKTMKNPRKQ